MLISLAAICPALFTTAFIIISQLTRGVNTFLQYIVPPLLAMRGQLSP
ncbi:DUF2776 family protein [Escherichia coli]